MKIEKKKRNISLQIIKSKVKIIYFPKKKTKENHNRQGQSFGRSDHLSPKYQHQKNKRQIILKTLSLGQTKL